MYSSLEEVYGDGFDPVKPTEGVHPSYPPYHSYPLNPVSFENLEGFAAPYAVTHSCNDHLQHISRCKVCQNRVRVKRNSWHGLFQQWMPIAMAILMVLLVVDIVVRLMPVFVGQRPSFIPDSVRLT